MPGVWASWVVEVDVASDVYRNPANFLAKLSKSAGNAVDKLGNGYPADWML